MTNYKEVFQLAQDKGYESFWYSDANFQDDMPLLPYCISELTLIQKWLRDEKGIDVLVRMDDGDRYISNHSVFLQTSYEEALLQGINEALKLI